MQRSTIAIVGTDFYQTPLPSEKLVGDLSGGVKASTMVLLEPRPD